MLFDFTFLGGKEITDLAVFVAENSLTCVARGTAIYLENHEIWKDTMESDENEF